MLTPPSHAITPHPKEIYPHQYLWDIWFENPSGVSISIVMQKRQHIAPTVHIKLSKASITILFNKSTIKTKNGERWIISWTVPIQTRYKPSKEDRDYVPEKNGAVSSIASDENSPLANVNYNRLLKYER